MTFRILAEAQFDAVEAAAWYDRCHPLLGNDFLDEIDLSLDIIRNRVYSLSSLETYSGKLDLRRVLLLKFPYMIVVVCREEESIAVAIAHLRRRPNFWLSRLKHT